MTDLISRADAIEAVKETKPIVRSTERNWGKMIAEQHSKELVKALKALPSADAEPTVIRCRTLMPTKDFKEWAKRVRETNPNAVVIPCDAEVISAEAVQGEWIVREYCTNELDYRRWIEIECPFCGEKPTYENLDNMNFCPNCGARMKGGAE